MLHSVPAPPPDPGKPDVGKWIPVKGRAWEAWELRALGEPWDGFADAPAYVEHKRVCKSWPRRQARRRPPTAQGHLACHVCGWQHHRVRRYPHGDRCRDHIAILTRESA
jgi:hypothetical protein